MILSTGSPLAPERLRLRLRGGEDATCASSSISGGTDIMGAFADANAVLPVYRGELQCRSPRHGGRGLRRERRAGGGREGRAGVHPAVSRRCRSASGTTAAASAIARRTSRKYPNVWTHGDWCELTERGTMLVYGRSDATLNPGGVRIGTAEIYRVVERIDEVEEAVAIGQLWPPEQADRHARGALRASCAAGLSSRTISKSASASRSAATRRRAMCRRASCR